MTTALIFLLSAAVGVGVFLVVRSFATPSATESELLEARLAQFSESGRVVSNLSEVEMSMPFFDRAMRPMFDRLSRTMSQRTPAQQTQAMQEKINLAGRPGNLTVGGFQVLRIAASILLGVVLGVPAALFAVGGLQGVLIAVIGVMLGYMLPNIMLGRRVRRRQKEILLALPSAIDLLTISVEAGLGFDAAIARVIEKYRNPLTAELNQALNEVRLGRPRHEALAEVGRRCKVEELTNFVQAVVQSEQLGVGIANVLRIQSEEIRRRRRQRAEEAGQKAPLKMLFPMIGCIFPTLFIVLLGPAILQVWGTLFH